MNYRDEHQLKPKPLTQTDAQSAGSYFWKYAHVPFTETELKFKLLHVPDLWNLNFNSACAERDWLCWMLASESGREWLLGSAWYNIIMIISLADVLLVLPVPIVVSSCWAPNNGNGRTGSKYSQFDSNARGRETQVRLKYVKPHYPNYLAAAVRDAIIMRLRLGLLLNENQHEDNNSISGYPRKSSDCQKISVSCVLAGVKWILFDVRWEMSEDEKRWEIPISIWSNENLNLHLLNQFPPNTNTTVIEICSLFQHNANS